MSLTREGSENQQRPSSSPGAWEGQQQPSGMWASCFPECWELARPSVEFRPVFQGLLSGELCCGPASDLLCAQGQDPEASGRLYKTLATGRLLNLR